MTALLGRLIREPLVHFFGLALLIFAAYGLLNQHAFSAKPRIEVDSARIEQISGLFQRTWKRQPTPDELNSLIADYVNGEIYYREAQRMGLDTDDAVVRQRMRLKMDLMLDVAVDQLQPTDKDLAEYLAAHADEFRTEPAIAFEQVFLRPDLHPGTLDKDAASLLDQLQKGQVTDVTAAGDATQLPETTPLTLVSRIARDFGEDFAAALAGLPVGNMERPGDVRLRRASREGDGSQGRRGSAAGRSASRGGARMEERPPQGTRGPAAGGLHEALRHRHRSCGGTCAMTLRSLIAVLVAMFWACAAAQAHELRPAFLDMEETSPNVFAVVWKVPAAGDMRLPLDLELPATCASAHRAPVNSTTIT